MSDELNSSIYNTKEYRKRKLKRRFYAFSVDIFTIALIDKIFLLSYLSFTSEYLGTLPSFIKSNIYNNLHEIKIPVLILVYFSYFFFSLYISGGKTLGKTAFALRVLSYQKDYHDLSFTESLMRSLGYTFCYLTGSILFVLPFLNKSQDGLPDLLSQTEVLTDEEYESYLTEVAKDLFDNGEIIQADFSANTDGQLDIFSKKAS